MLIMAELPKLDTEISMCVSVDFFLSQVVKFLCQFSHWLFFERERVVLLAFALSFKIMSSRARP